MTRLMLALLCMIAWFAPATANSRSHYAPIPWELHAGRCNVPSRELTLSQRLMCSEKALRQLDGTLTAAYRNKANSLDSAQLFALYVDQNLWFSLCQGRTGDLSVEATRACLLTEIPKLRDFVSRLTVDPVQVPYRLTRFERALLQRYAGAGFSPIGRIDGPAREDAYAQGLRRVIGAVLPKQFDPGYEGGYASAADLYIHIMTTSAGNIEADRYFVASGAMPRNGTLEAMFIVDMTTGDAAFAMMDVTQVYDMPPTLDVWVKTCVPTPFKEFSLGRFREGAKKAATIFHKEPVEKLVEKVTDVPCDY